MLRRQHRDDVRRGFGAAFVHHNHLKAGLIALLEQPGQQTCQRLRLVLGVYHDGGRAGGGRLHRLLVFDDGEALGEQTVLVGLRRVFHAHAVVGMGGGVRGHAAYTPNVHREHHDGAYHHGGEE